MDQLHRTRLSSKVIHSEAGKSYVWADGFQSVSIEEQEDRMMHSMTVVLSCQLQKGYEPTFPSMTRGADAMIASFGRACA